MADQPDTGLQAVHMFVYCNILPTSAAELDAVLLGEEVVEVAALAKIAECAASPALSIPVPSELRYSYRISNQILPYHRGLPQPIRSNRVGGQRSRDVDALRGLLLAETAKLAADKG